MSIKQKSLNPIYKNAETTTSYDSRISSVQHHQLIIDNVIIHFTPMIIKAMSPLKPVMCKTKSQIKKRKLSSSYSYSIFLQQLLASISPFPATFPLSKKDSGEVGVQWPFKSFPSLVPVSAFSGSMLSVFLLFWGTQKTLAWSLSRGWTCTEGWAGELIWPRQGEGDVGVHEIPIWPQAKFCFHQLLFQTLMRQKLTFLTSLVPLTEKPAPPNPTPTVN